MRGRVGMDDEEEKERKRMVAFLDARDTFLGLGRRQYCRYHLERPS